MSSSFPEYKTVWTREAEANPLKHRTLHLTPWVVQNIVFELIANYSLANDPNLSQFPFPQRYDPNPKKSTLHIAIANHWEPGTPEKRPAIFIEREDATYRNMVMNQVSGYNVPESELQKLSTAQMNVNIACIAKGVGSAEAIAEYVRNPFLQFQQEIRKDFGFRMFKLAAVSKPQKYVESQDNFIVLLTVQTAFDDNWIVKGDDLKIKTVSRIIFDSLTGKPVTDQ